MPVSTSFTPAMISETRGFEPRSEPDWCIYDDVVVDLWRVEACEGASGRYLSPDPHVFVSLDLQCSSFELTVGSGQSAAHGGEPAFSFVPALEMASGRALGAGALVHLDLHFPESAVTRRFGDGLDPIALRRPLLARRDPEVLALARLLATECARPLRECSRPYGHALVDALLAKVMGVGDDAALTEASPLDRRTLREVLAYIDAHAAEAVTLRQLADVAMMSESRFGQAFRQTTGTTPMKWHMQRRIAEVQRALLKDEMGLTDLAGHFAFVDQAHLTRSFTAIVGQPPGRWLQDLRRSERSRRKQ